MSSNINSVCTHQLSHNHQTCIEQAFTAAKQLCDESGLRLTPVRKHVLQIIWQSHKPIGAYAIMDELSKLERRTTAPPTVYRALDFLMENGLVHRLTSLNAFIGCMHPHKIHQGQFLLCQKCHNALEVNDNEISQAINLSTQKYGFQTTKQMVEIVGICGTCQKTS